PPAALPICRLRPEFLRIDCHPQAQLEQPRCSRQSHDARTQYGDRSITRGGKMIANDVTHFAGCPPTQRYSRTSVAVVVDDELAGTRCWSFPLEAIAAAAKGPGAGDAGRRRGKGEIRGRKIHVCGGVHLKNPIWLIELQLISRGRCNGGGS